MTLVKDVLLVWQRIGILDVILPFILVFAIVYGILERTKVLGEENNQYNPIVAFVLGFLVVAALQVVNVLQTIVQYSALGVIAIMFVTVIGRFMGGMKEPEKQSYPKYIAFVFIALLGFYALGFSGWITLSFIESSILPIAISLGLVLFVVYLVLRPGKSKKEQVPVPEEEGPATLEKEKRIEKIQGRGRV